MLYDILLGIVRAARDTGVRVKMQVRESDPLSAAIKAEELADRKLAHPRVEYTHAMQVTPASRKALAVMVELPLAA